MDVQILEITICQTLTNGRKLSACNVRILEICTRENASCHDRALQIHTSQVGLHQVGPAEVTAPQVAARQIAAFQGRIFEYRARQISTAQIRARQHGSGEVSPCFCGSIRQKQIETFSLFSNPERFGVWGALFATVQDVGFGCRATRTLEARATQVAALKVEVPKHHPL